MWKSRIAKFITVIGCLLAVAAIVVAIQRHRSADAALSPGQIEQQMEAYRSFISQAHLQTDIVLAGSRHEDEDAVPEGIRLYYDETTALWNAYIPSDLVNDLHIYFTQFQGIQFEGDSTVYHSGDAIPTKDSNYKVNANLILWDGTSYSKEYSTRIYFFYGYGTASLYLTDTEDSGLSSLHAEENTADAITADYAVYTSDSKMAEYGTLQAGASEEKGYDQQESYDLTLSSGEVWQLLPDYIETAEQVRNKTALDLAHYLGIPETRYGELVNLYENGVYRGLYLLTSSEKKTWSHSSERSLTYSGNEGSADSSAGEASAGNTENHTAASMEEVSWEEAPEAVKAYAEWYNAHEGTERQNTVLYQGLWKELDKDSFLRMYLLQDFLTSWQGDFQVLKEQNSGGGSGKGSSGALLVAGNPWKYRLSCGHTTRQDYPILTRQSLWLQNHLRPSDGEGISGWTSLLAKLGDEPSFEADLQALWEKEFYPILQNFIQNDLPVITYEAVSSGTMSNDLYQQTRVESDTSVWFLRQWLMKRTAFLEAYRKAPESYVKLVFHTALGELAYYAREGETLEELPVTEQGEGTDYYSQNGDYDEIAGWVDEEGNALSQNTVITRAMEGTVFNPVS